FRSVPAVVMVLSSASRLRLFRVVFSEPGRAFYSSGDKLSGSVQLEAEQPCRVAGLRVTAAGCARVQPRKKRGRSQEVEYLKYDEDVRLEEALSSGEAPRSDSRGISLSIQVSIESSHKKKLYYPDQRLVSSFRGKLGSVRYYVRAELRRPSKHALQCEKEFQVEEPLDVNRADLLAPVAASAQKKVTCMFIPDGQVSISAQIDRKGFCEGEDIFINAKFENTCSRIVVPKAAIIAKHLYAVDGRTKVLRQKLSAVRGNHIISGMCDMWQGRTIKVPKLKPSLLGCDIIQVDYALMIYLHIPGSEKLTLELPLVIGTIPFSGVGSRTSSMCSQAGSSWTSFPSAPPSYSNIHRDLRMAPPLPEPGSVRGFFLLKRSFSFPLLPKCLLTHEVV
uniref:Thioredoxin-interacting protein n=1 Tax=Oreochromis niloticus TaxID=8128 RepID=A0A669C204_ORENI